MWTKIRLFQVKGKDLLCLRRFVFAAASNEQECDESCQCEGQIAIHGNEFSLLVTIAQLAPSPWGCIDRVDG